MEDIAKSGIELAIRVKETFRINIKHPLRKKSKEGWNKFGRYRYLIESLFGNVNQKLGFHFRVKNQEIAKKMGLAVFAIYNMYLLVIFFFLITTLFLTIFHLFLFLIA